MQFNVSLDKVTSVAAVLRSIEHALSGQEHVQLGKSGNSQRLSCNCLILPLPPLPSPRCIFHFIFFVFLPIILMWPRARVIYCFWVLKSAHGAGSSMHA